MYITLSKALCLNKKLSVALGTNLIYAKSLVGIDMLKVSGIVVWKANLKPSRKLASKYNIPLISVEEAFISSLPSRYNKRVEIGFYIDKTGGKYYTESDMTEGKSLLINPKWKITAENLAQTKEAIELITQNNIIKYNNFRSKNVKFEPVEGAARILVVDQTFGDASITQNNNGKESFVKMVNEALLLAGGKKIYVKLHPKKSKGYLESIINKEKCILIEGSVNIFEVLENVDDVFTVSSGLGFEALLVGKNVHVFGKPFYAGYGLTKNYGNQAFYCNRSLEEVFFVFYIHSCKYVIGNNLCSILDAIRVIIKNKEHYLEDSKKRFFMWNIPMWKRKRFIDYLNSENIYFTNKFEFMRKKGINSNDRIVVWGKSGFKNTDLESFAIKNEVKIVTCEDGFIRSKGLGSNFVYPSSLVFDENGIYFDCRKESDIEITLNTHVFTDEEKLRGEKLINMIKKNNISKYNIGGQNSLSYLEQIKEESQGKNVILITGQVSDDASIIYGSINFSKYLDLIKSIRSKNPNAYIIYKPHPDVIQANRRGFISSSVLAQYVDKVVNTGEVISYFDVADEIHTITSLSGFEALIRNKKVYTYGLPFYAGYGLTNDVHISHRRLAIRTVQELVFVTLVKYPRYFIEEDAIFSTPEMAILSIANSKMSKKASFVRRRLGQISNLSKLFVLSSYRNISLAYKRKVTNTVKALQLKVFTPKAS